MIRGDSSLVQSAIVLPLFYVYPCVSLKIRGMGDQLNGQKYMG